MKVTRLLKHPVSLFCLVPLFFAVAGGSARAGCMSCLSNTGSGYTELACEGDSRFDVARKCGDPDYSEVTGEIVTGQFGAEKRKDTPQGGFAASRQTVEKLYYNCGQGRFVKVLTFVSGRLVTMENGDRGSGRQKCW